MSHIHHHRYDNGLILLVEPTASVASVGMTLLLPAGVVHEPTDRQGLGTLLSEIIFRGAGDLDARAHSNALDLLGVRRDSEISAWHTRLTATMMGDRLYDALPILLDMARRPHLNDEALDPAVQLAISAIQSLEDNPQEKVMIETKRRHLGELLGRSVYGQQEHLAKTTIDDVREFFSNHYVSDGAILALAGHVEFEPLRDRIGQLLGDWTGQVGEPSIVPPASSGYHHLSAETQQQHIGVAYRTVSQQDKLNMTQHLAVAVLSGGMSSRLFTEVREKRGLCYSVYASYAAGRDLGTVYAYAGTATARAKETLKVMTGELTRLAEGVDEDEYERAKVGLKSRLVMQGESTSARAAAIASDQFLLGHPRTLADIEAQLDSVTLGQLNDFVASHQPKGFTTLNIGPEPLMSN